MGPPFTPEVTCLHPSGCGMCGAELTGRRRRWCSDDCANRYYRNHVWNVARWEAHVRAGHKCVGCGARSEEIDHITERNGHPIGQHSCLHHQDNLRAVCHNCHVNRATLLDPPVADPQEVLF